MKNHLFSVDEVNPIAAMGIQQWIAHGEPIDDILRDQLIAATFKNAPLSIRAALLRLTPDDEGCQQFGFPIPSPITWTGI